MNTFKSWASVLIAISLLPNVAVSADAATDAIAKGDSLMEKGDYDAAIAAFNEAIRIDPKNAVAYSDRGRAYDYKGDHDKAVADNTEAIRLDPHLAKAYSRRGYAYEEIGNLDNAIADYTDAIRLDPKCANGYRFRGWVYGLKGEHDKAIADYKEAIRLDPNDAKTYCSRGCFYGSKGDPDKAIADFTEAIRLDPKMAGAVLQPRLGLGGRRAIPTRPLLTSMRLSDWTHRFLAIMRCVARCGLAAEIMRGASPISNPQFGSTPRTQRRSSRPRPKSRSRRQQFGMARSKSVKCCAIDPPWHNSARKPEYCINGRHANSPARISTRKYFGMPRNRFLLMPKMLTQRQAEREVFGYAERIAMGRTRAKSNLLRHCGSRRYSNCATLPAARTSNGSHRRLPQGNWRKRHSSPR